MRAVDLMLVAQMISRDDAERYEIVTGRKAPWSKNDIWQERPRPGR